MCSPTILQRMSRCSCCTFWKIFFFLSSTIKKDFLGPTAFMCYRLAFSVRPWDMGGAEAKILHFSCLRLQSPTARIIPRNTGYFFFNSFFSCLADSSCLFIWREFLCCRIDPAHVSESYSYLQHFFQIVHFYPIHCSFAQFVHFAPLLHVLLHFRV